MLIRINGVFKKKKLYRRHCPRCPETDPTTNFLPGRLARVAGHATVAGRRDDTRACVNAGGGHARGTVTLRLRLDPG